jgi:hypothetical protein
MTHAAAAIMADNCESIEAQARTASPDPEPSRASNIPRDWGHRAARCYRRNHEVGSDDGEIARQKWSQCLPYQMCLAIRVIIKPADHFL